MNPPKIKTSAGMETVDQTVARAKAQLGDAYVAPAKIQATTTPVITPSSLNPTPAPVVSPAPVLTDTTKLQTDLAAQQEDALTQKVAADKKASEATKNNAYKALFDQMAAAKGLNTLQAEAYAQKGGVNDITPELNDINDQIRREQRSLELAKRNVTEKGGGLASGAAAEISNLERVSLQKQADLSIIQMAVQGRYDSAKEIADRAVAAQFEEQSKKLDIAKFDYTENKDLFTTAEKREYDLLFADRERKLEEAKATKTSIQNFALQALQAGASVAETQRMMQAKTLDEAMAIGGGYLRPKPVEKSTKPSITEIDGKPYVWDEASGQYIPAGEYIKGGGMDAQQSEQLNSTLALARELKQNPSGFFTGKGSAVGASLAKFLPFGQSLGLQGNRTAFENKVNTLKANLTLDNLSLLKGPMSDKDLAFLQAIGSSLTTSMSEAEFDKELGKVITKLEKGQNAAPLPQAPSAQGIDFRLYTGKLVTAPDGTQIELVD